MVNRRDRISLWQDAELPDGMEILRASCFDLRYPAHFHDEFVIAAFSRGAQRHRISHFEGVAEAGTLMIIPPGEVHTGEAVERSDGWDYCAWYPSARFVEAIADDILTGHGHVDFGRDALRHDPGMASRLLAASAVLASSCDLLEKECAVHEVLAMVIARYGERSVRPLQAGHSGVEMRRVMDFLSENFACPLSVKTIAAVVGLSEYHFMRIFRSATGLSVHQYLTQLRVNNAKTLLSRGMSSAETALAVGFFDQSHFINRFRSYYGVTPGSYVEACR